MSSGALQKTDSDANAKEHRAKVEKAKSKGRFQIIENDDKTRASKSQVSLSEATLGRRWPASAEAFTTPKHVVSVVSAMEQGALHLGSPHSTAFPGCTMACG